MKYVFDVLNERGLALELAKELDCLTLTIRDDEDYKSILLDEEGLYELIGILHHIQKQINKK
jgi:hypothetical protein